MSEHILKVAPAYMDAILDGTKPFEIRRNDRGFQTGDTLILWEYGADSSSRYGVPCDKWDCRDHRHRTIRKVVTYVFSGDPALRDCGGVVPGYVVLGLGDHR